MLLAKLRAFELPAATTKSKPIIKNAKIKNSKKDYLVLLPID